MIDPAAARRRSAGARLRGDSSPRRASRRSISALRVQPADRRGPGLVGGVAGRGRRARSACKARRSPRRRWRRRRCCTASRAASTTRCRCAAASASSRAPAACRRCARAPLPLVIGHTGKARDTKGRVARVAELLGERSDEVRGRFAAIAELVARGADAVARGSSASSAQAMTREPAAPRGARRLVPRDRAHVRHRARRRRLRRQAHRRRRRRLRHRRRQRRAAVADAWRKAPASRPSPRRWRMHEGRRARQHQHRAGQVLGQARRRAQPAGGRLAVADARRAVDAHRASSSTASSSATRCSSTARPPTSARPGASPSSSTSCARAPASRERAAVESSNNFPTAAGLASSASAFAALALAATRAAGLTLSDRELSMLARRGSGSAARSIFGGFVEMHRGERADGEDSFAEPIVTDWDVRLVIAATTQGPKATLSTDGMRHTAETSPYYDAWVKMSPRDLETARDAIARRDLQALGEVTEASCLSMHASAMAARPAVLYFVGATIEGYRTIQELRKRRRAGVVHLRRRPARQGAHRRGPRRTRSRRRWRVLGKTWICSARAARGGDRMSGAHGRRPRAGQGDPVAASTPCCTARPRSPSPSIATSSPARRMAARNRRSCARAKESRPRTAARRSATCASTRPRSTRAARSSGSALRRRSPPPSSGCRSPRRSARSTRRAVFAIADAAHAEAQGTRGSGVDVACSVYGGAIRFVRKNGDVDVRSVDLPDGVRITFIWAGQPRIDGGADRAASRRSPNRAVAARSGDSQPRVARARLRQRRHRQRSGGAHPRRRRLRQGHGRARRSRRLRDRHPSAHAIRRARASPRRRGQAVGRRRRRPRRRLHRRQRRDPAAARRRARGRPHPALARPPAPGLRLENA